MNHGFGREVPARHVDAPHRAVTRQLLVIDAGGVTVARLYLPSGELVSEIDAGSEEVTSMTHGLVPVQGASGPEWDRALAGHSDEERRAALVYQLDV
ncbi:MAG: hypothetical protein KIT17_28330 [Rubrivivax sp.]|nr:hypothetical protein [Rubrivivax sp.]